MSKVLKSTVFCEGKTEELNDDTYVTGSMFAVIDGATAKDELKYVLNDEEMTSGKFAAHTVAEAIKNLDINSTVTEQIQTITEHLNTRILEQHPNIKHSQRPSAVATVFNPSTNILWSVGDVWYGYETNTGEVYSHKNEIAPDTILPLMRSYVLTTLKIAEELPEDLNVSDPGREAIEDMLKLQGFHANNPKSPWGYGVFNGLEVPLKYVQTYKIPDDTSRVILASDGYPEIEVEGDINLLAAEKRLASLLDEDPYGIDKLITTKIKKKGYNSFDDRTWLELNIQ